MRAFALRCVPPWRHHPPSDEPNTHPTHPPKQVKLVKCVVSDVVVDVSFDTVGGLCTVAFLEAADRRIARQHLFKRSILLVRANPCCALLSFFLLWLAVDVSAVLHRAPASLPSAPPCRCVAAGLLRLRLLLGMLARFAARRGSRPRPSVDPQATVLALPALLQMPTTSSCLASPATQLKAWCYYESRLLGAHHGLISSYALEVLVLYIFNLYHAELHTPLDVSLGWEGWGGWVEGGPRRCPPALQSCTCLWT